MQCCSNFQRMLNCCKLMRFPLECFDILRTGDEEGIEAASFSTRRKKIVYKIYWKIFFDRKNYF